MISLKFAEKNMRYALYLTTLDRLIQILSELLKIT